MQKENPKQYSLEPDALGKLSTELAEHANAWSLILPRSVLSCELLKSLDTSLAPLNFRVESLNLFISFGELRSSFDCRNKYKNRKRRKTLIDRFENVFGILKDLLINICGLRDVQTARVRGENKEKFLSTMQCTSENKITGFMMWQAIQYFCL